MKLRKTSIMVFIVTLLMLVSILQVSAFSEDFSASSAGIIHVGECSTVVNSVIVKNTGAITSSYSVKVDSEVGSWISYVPTAFILKPGESEQVFVYIKAPCGSEGSYDINTYVITKLGVEKLLEQEIKVHKTQNIDVKAVTFNDKINPCESAVFDFDITNTGTFLEVYEFSTDTFVEKTVFSADTISIESGKTARLRMFTTPECNVWGNYTLNLITNAKFSKSHAETSGINMDISRNYDFSLVFGELYTPIINKTPVIEPSYGVYSLCEYENGAIPVLIENKGSVPNKYFFNLDGVEWASLGGDVISLAPSDSAYVNININPSEPMVEDTTLVFGVESELGGIKKETELNVKVDICHIPVISEDVSKIKTYYNESYANLSIVNTGSMQTEYKLSLEGADWISILPAEIELAPGAKGYFYLHLNPSNATAEGKYYVNVKAEVEGSAIHSREIVVSIKDPRFTNMIFDEYLPFTLLAIVLLVLCAIGSVFFVVYLENTKDERMKVYEKRRKALENLRAQKQKLKEQRMQEKEKLRLERQKQLEKIRLEKEKAREKKRIEREKKKLAKQKEKARKKEEKEKKKQAKLNLKTAKTIKSAKPEGKKRNLKWLWWTLGIIAAVVILALIVIGLIKSFSTLWLYKYYFLIGLAVLATIIIILVVGEYLLSQWYKNQIWKSLVPGQKGVVLLTWKKGLGELVIRLKKPVEKAGIKVRKHPIKPTFMTAGEKVYQYFEVEKKNFENKDIDKISFRFKIKKKWLTKHNIPADTIKLTRYNAERWTTLPTNSIMEDKKYVYYQTDIASCSFFAITGKPKPIKVVKVEKVKPVKVVAVKKVVAKKVLAKKKKKVQIDYAGISKAIGFVLLALIVLGIVGYGVFYAVKTVPSLMNRTSNMTDTEVNVTLDNSTIDEIADDINETLVEIDEIINDTEQDENITVPELEENITLSENLTEEDIGLSDEEIETMGGIPSQTWDEDTVHIIDLMDYFEDPDNDALEFNYTELENINVEIDEAGIAYLTPDRNWFGEDKIVFTGDDGKGGIVNSNEVRLIVEDVVEPPLMEKLKEGFSSYSNYIMIGVLILVILILLIEFRKPIMKFLEED